MGIAALEALEQSQLPLVVDQSLISAVLDAVVEPVAGGYDDGDVVREVR